MFFLEVLLLITICFIPGFLLLNLLLPDTIRQGGDGNLPGGLVLSSIMSGYLAIFYIIFNVGVFIPFHVNFLTAGFASVSLSFLIYVLAGKRLSLKYPGFGLNDLSLLIHSAIVFAVYFCSYDQSSLIEQMNENSVRVLSGVYSRPLYIPSLYELNVTAGMLKNGYIAFFFTPLLLFSDIGSGEMSLFALACVTISLFSYHTAEKLFRKRWISYAAFYISSFNPVFLRYGSMSNYFLVLAFVSFIIFLLFQERERLLPFIAFISACVINSSIDAILFLFSFSFITVSYYGRTPLFRFLAFLIIFSIPFAVLNYFVLNYQYETSDLVQTFIRDNYNFSPFNFPFSEKPLRMPFLPFPTFLMWLLYIAKYSGLILASIAALGFYALYRNNKKIWIFAASGV